MRTHRAHPVRFAVAVLAVLGAPASAQEPVARPAAVAVIGASVSAGFVDRITGTDAERNQTLRLAAVLGAVWPRERADIRSFADAMFFLDPDAKGVAQVERALRAAPDLVVGIDFLFWFGYGDVGASDDPTAARLARLGKGLALLERLPCPLVVGDLPDMRDANPRMLPPRLVPSVEELAAVNEAIHAWAGARPGVAVFPLAEWVQAVRQHGDTVESGGRRISLPPEALLQTDRLHATRLGVGLLVHRLVPRCLALLPPEHPLRDHLPDFGELIEQIGADVELPEPAAAAPAGAGGDKRG